MEEYLFITNRDCFLLAETVQNCLFLQNYTMGLAFMCSNPKIAMLSENLTMTLFLWLLEHSFVQSREKAGELTQ